MRYHEWPFDSLLRMGLLLIMVGNHLHAEEQVIRYDDGQGGQMWYRLYLPDNYDPSVSYPLTTFLHGSNGQNIRPVVNPDADVERAPANLVGTLSTNEYQSILIAPQLERGSWRSFDNDRLIREAISDVQTTYGTDAQRRYLTGLSFGGFGTFHMLQEYPSYFAAGAPIAGFYNPEVEFPNPFDQMEFDRAIAAGYADYAERVKNIPIWAFHGTNDNVVPVEATRIVVNALREADANLRYSELPREQHNIWDRIYDNDDFPATAVYRMEVDTASQTFEVLVDVGQDHNSGLYRLGADLVGVDTVQNLAPQAEFSPVVGASVGFVNSRSADDDPSITAAQKALFEAGIVDRFGQLPGFITGSGTGEIQLNYDAPLLIAAGTFSDLEALGFSTKFNRANLASAYSQFILDRSDRRVPRYGVSYRQIFHDGVLVYSDGDHGEFYPWLFQQRLVPEPSSGVLIALLLLSIAAGHRRS